MVAASSIGGIIAPLIGVLIVPLVLQYLSRSAQSESIAQAGTRFVGYPKALRIFVIGGWVFAAGLAVLLWFIRVGQSIWASVFLIFFLGAIFLPLHLEIFRAFITWDDANIYTYSPWRRRRTVPFSAVKSCDFSISMQWYRIYTEGQGIIRLHALMRGVPELLRSLPCPTPPYPPPQAK
jgi:hypothetical protein